MFWHTGKFLWLFGLSFRYSIQDAAVLIRQLLFLWQNSKDPKQAAAFFPESLLDMIFFVQGASKRHVTGIGYQMPSSSRSFSQEILSPGSFRAFHASSVSNCSSSSCRSFKSYIETIAASASPRLVNTKDSLPYATLFIIFANFFLAIRGWMEMGSLDIAICKL